MRFIKRNKRILEITIQIMEIHILLNTIMGLQEQINDLPACNLIS